MTLSKNTTAAGSIMKRKSKQELLDLFEFAAKEFSLLQFVALDDLTRNKIDHLRKILEEIRKLIFIP